MTPLMSADLTVFDGSSREILYQTSSHAGQRQLQELLRMVPGGQGMTVTKMPYSWKKNPEGIAKIHGYPVIIARLGNHFNPPFSITKALIPEKKIEEAVAEFDESVRNRLERDQPAVWVGINGHWHQRDGSAQGAALLASAEVHRRWQAANTNPAVTVLDTITPCHAHHPLTVASDHFHAGGVAGYVEGLAIVRALCANDGIELPQAVEAHVEQMIAEAADKRDAFVITAPKGIEPKTTFAMGDSITCEWTVTDPSVRAVYVMLHRLGHNDYFLSDRIEVGSAESGRLTWTIQDDLPTVGNRVNDIGRITPATAKTELFKRKIPGGQQLFCFRIVNADDPATYTFSDSFTIPLPKR
jgi:hypothetical protein